MQRDAVQIPTAARDKIIVPLDVPTAQAARELIKAIGGTVGFFKIGNQLFTSAGPNIVQEVRASGSKVFLDLKYHDIPNTVRHAVESASALGVDMLTIHLSGGRAMCEAAVLGRGISNMLILGVTVLTSLNDIALSEIGFRGSVQEEVLIACRTCQKGRDHRFGCQSAGTRHSPRALWFSLHDGDPGDPPRLVGVRRPEADNDTAAGDRGRSRLSRDRPPDHGVAGPEESRTKNRR